ncbi:MAG TPA: RsmG family class I SAM-dependent methyltransferase, partial [Lachnospiraceae bacterium]|nr:RsmG family class I SAM-dependent methyltransferase [Lachnospiraceae bacterium]
KRVTFLETVIHELGLEDIKAVHGRAEDLAKTLEYREIFDICVSRAVANLAVLSEFCIPFVREGGDFISYKAETASEEIEEAKKAIDLLGGKYEKTVSMKLPFTEYGRNLILIHKCDTTNSKYPRKAGIPIKRPLV